MPAVRPPFSRRWNIDTDEMSVNLAGIGVLVTRPAKQAHGLRDRLKNIGAIPLPYPLFEIVGRSPPAAADLSVDYDWLIFISANAVDHGLPWLVDSRAAIGSRVAAVGPASAAALAESGVQVDLLPGDEFSSTGLLAMPALQQVAGARCLIVRGLGGKGTLARELKRRGAAVEYLECYERLPATLDTDALRAWVTRSQVKVVTFTSSRGAERFWESLPEDLKPWAITAPLAVLSTAVADRARRLGLHGRCEAARQATDDGLVQAICVSAAAP